MTLCGLLTTVRICRRHRRDWSLPGVDAASRRRTGPGIDVNEWNLMKVLIDSVFQSLSVSFMVLRKVVFSFPQ
jgi:hypothetical protein